MTLRCFLVLAGLAVCVQAQNQTPLASSPMNAPPDQVLSLIVTQADQLKGMGKYDEALGICNDAMERIRKDPSLQPREEEVLQRLSSLSILVQRPAEAVKYSTRILSLHKANCQPGSPGVERCADAQYGLGFAMMHAGDFRGAVTQLTESAANFDKVWRNSDETFRGVKLQQRGHAESLLAAALFRAGEKEKSIAAFRKAIATLRTVADNEKLDPGTRGSARTSQQDAQSSLDMLLKDGK